MKTGSETQLGKWGHSLAVRIPKTVAENARLEEGDRLTVSLGRDGTIVIKPARRMHSLGELVGRITPRNRHGEIEWGGPVGKETW
ncbi:MAG TPA: AbrB/MazE/SpoVT family DNA-binding domain-containing protein [Terriglobia bacterium]|nr:AbrB/MazE/SpoVT family DNA-binding domain-containing protein [Terriglobia bacterium]HKT12902.1 AbrB/MazE/SpoVT family DNA-binding domain-containing protein [Terriglobia bacterium]